MKKSLLTIVLALVFISIFYFIFLNNKNRTFKKVEKLNLILIENNSIIKNSGQNCLIEIENNIIESNNLVNNLKEKGLISIACYRNMYGSETIYLFKGSKDKVYYFIFAEKEGRLERLRGYEQFIDCAKQKKINNNWILSEINYNCNN